MPLDLTRTEARTAAMEYQTFHVTIEDILGDPGAFDHTVTDPPYSLRTQENIRRGRQRGAQISAPVTLDFAPADTERRQRWARTIARLTRRWALVFSDHEGSVEWGKALELAGMEYIRCMPWVRTGDVVLTSQRPRKSGTPQFTGDRPATAHEVIVVAHSRRCRKRWNGGGKQGVYTHAVVPPSQRVHDNEKPVGLLEAIIRDFCDPGETIFDPFCGSGAALVAAKHLRLCAAGADMSARWAQFSRRRVLAAAAGTGIDA